MKRRAARWEAEHCDFEVLAWISHLIEPERVLRGSVCELAFCGAGRKVALAMS